MITNDIERYNTDFDRYQRAAMDFVHRYPFTMLMDERHIDYSTACVREGVDINVCLIGFGKINQHVFLTSVETNQFVTKCAGGVRHKPVMYHVFDKDVIEKRKKLDDTYYRYRNECKSVDASRYLPLPDMPAIEQYYPMDVNDVVFYDTMRAVVCKSEKDVNLAIVAVGTDEENVALANNLVAKMCKPDVNNVAVFAYVRGEWDSKKVLNSRNCFLFGENIQFNSACDIYKMAQHRNKLYAQAKGIADVDWTEKDEIKKQSSICACLSLRYKLNMMGLDCSISNCYFHLKDKKFRLDERTPVSKDDYFKRYAFDDDISCRESGNSLRKTFAIMEHYRWNAFMITKGFVPATVEQIVNETVDVDGKIKHTNGTRYQEHRHGNLTTFDGLIDFGKLVAQRDNVSEEEADVIKYDYQLMDDAYEIIEQDSTYKIVERS